MGDGIRGVAGRSHLGDGERPVEAGEPRDGIPREAALDRLDRFRPVLAGRSERADLAALQRLHALHRLDRGEDVGQQQVALAVREDRRAAVRGAVQHLEEAQCAGIAGQRAFHRLPARDLAPGRGRRLHHEVDRLLRTQRSRSVELVLVEEALREVRHEPRRLVVDADDLAHLQQGEGRRALAVILAAVSHPVHEDHDPVRVEPARDLRLVADVVRDSPSRVGTPFNSAISMPPAACALSRIAWFAPESRKPESPARG